MEEESKIPEVDVQEIPTGIYEILRNWQNQKNDYEIFSYLASKLFNIIRLPTYYDRQICSISENVIDKYFYDLDDLVSQLDILYKYTQRRLEKAGYQAQDRVKLYRAICKVKHLKEKNLNRFYVNISKLDDEIEPIVLAAYLVFLKESSASEIELEVDILSSWSQIASNHVYGCIQLEREVEVKDILYFNAYGDYNGPLESNEWLVINRFNTGILKFDSEDIKYKEGFEDIPETLKSKFSFDDCEVKTKKFLRERKMRPYLSPFSLNQIQVPSYKCHEKLLKKLFY